LAVERIPTDPKSGYARQVVWFDSEEYRVLKIDYYDRSNALLKSLELRGYRRYAEAYWRPDEMRMVNHQTGKSTTLRWRDYRFGVGLREGDFDRNRLSRVR
jgi:outer membrane lipoprotein-sorting protein